MVRGAITILEMRGVIHTIRPIMWHRLTIPCPGVIAITTIIAGLGNSLDAFNTGERANRLGRGDALRGVDAGQAARGAGHRPRL